MVVQESRLYFQNERIVMTTSHMFLLCWNKNGGVVSKMNFDYFVFGRCYKQIRISQWDIKNRIFFLQSSQFQNFWINFLVIDEYPHIKKINT